MKVDLSLTFQSWAPQARFVNFQNFCHLFLHFYEVKMVSQYNYTGSFDEFVQACL